MPGVIHAPECNTYRPGPFTSASAVVDYYEYILQNEAHVAAMIVEPVVGAEFESLVERYIDNLIERFGGEVA